MNNLVTPKRVFIKSRNSVRKIYDKYTISLVLFTILSLLMYFIFGYKELIIPTLKPIVLSLIITSIFGYIVNLFKKDYNFIHIYTKDNYHLIAMIIGLFARDINIYVLICAILLSVIIKNVFKGINVSSSLYGIALILLYRVYQGSLITPLTNFKEMGFFGTKEDVLAPRVLDYVVGVNYLNPVIPVLSFIYLFHKKVIKYNIVFSYFLTFFMIMLLYGIFGGMSLWFLFFQITTGSLSFIIIYLLSDTTASPSTSEGAIIYGMLLAIISVILRFIIPELAIIVTLIFGEQILARIIEVLSFKLRENPRLYYLIVILLFMIAIATLLVLSIVY
jgi:hypothetical protein